MFHFYIQQREIYRYLFNNRFKYKILTNILLQSLTTHINGITGKLHRVL